MMSDKLRAAAQAALKSTKSLHVCCSDFNHSKKDLHDGGKCPPLQRYNDALAALEAALAESKAEYICKCGLRVTPHYCKTDKEF
jgi:hypothetical protein